MVSLLTPPPSPDLSCQKAGSSEGIFQLPESVLVQIFLLLPLGDRLQVARYVVFGGVFFFSLWTKCLEKEVAENGGTPH